MSDFSAALNRLTAAQVAYTGLMPDNEEPFINLFRVIQDFSVAVARLDDIEFILLIVEIDSSPEEQYLSITQAVIDGAWKSSAIAEQKTAS